MVWPMSDQSASVDAMSGDQPAISVPQGDRFNNVSPDAQGDVSGIDAQGRKVVRSKNGDVLTEVSPGSGSFANLQLQAQDEQNSAVNKTLYGKALRGRPYIPYHESSRLPFKGTSDYGSEQRVKYFADQLQKKQIDKDQLDRLVTQGHLSSDDLTHIDALVNPSDKKTYELTHGVGSWANKISAEKEAAADDAKRQSDQNNNTLLPGIPDASLVPLGIGVAQGVYGGKK